MDLFSLSTSTGLDLKGALEGALGTGHGQAQFELRIGTFLQRELEVVSFKGHEKLNAPYTYEVVFKASLPVAALQVGIFGFPACLSIQAPGHEPRVIQGIAASFESVGAAASELTTKMRRYTTRIVPRLWLLNHRRKYRVFQDASAIDIALSVLADADITPDVKLERDAYPPIPFVYQRGETDLELVDRVLATAGVFYYFQHASGLLDQLLPGAGEIGAMAGGLGGVIGGAASTLGIGASVGAAAGVSSAVAKGASIIGAATTMVLSDQARHTAALRDTSLSASVGGVIEGGIGGALDPIGAAVGGALGSFAGKAASAVTGAIGAGLNAGDALVYDDSPGAATQSERVFAFRVRKEVRPKAVKLRDWNLAANEPVTGDASSAPAVVDLSIGLTAALDLTGHASLSMSAPTLDASVDALPIASNDVTVHEYQRDAALLAAEKGWAQHALDQLRSDWITARGESDCRRLAPGYRFSLANHPIGPVNTEYLVTEMRCTGNAEDHLSERNPHLYRNRFRCVPSVVDPKPKKPAVMPGALGPEPAQVVGPVWGDVYTDRIGRILVRFRWAPPSSGPAMDHAEGTCWVHWLERWGGDGYGTLTLPRVGSEVLVDFLRHEGGRPIAVGQIYSLVNAPPFPLPQEASKVGIRSRTIPGGPGFSEISIDDLAGSEKVRVRANGELETEVMRATSTTLHGTYDLEVGQERNETTTGDASFTFASDCFVATKGTLTHETDGDRVDTVRGSTTEAITGDAVRTVSGRVDTVIEGSHNSHFESDSVERHLGHRVVIVGGPEQVRSLAVHVEGAARAYAKREIEVVSLAGLTVRCGKSEIRIGPDAVTISSPTISLVTKSVAIATEKLSAAVKDSLDLRGKTVKIAGSGAAVVLDDNAAIDGGKVKLNSGGSSSGDDAKKKETKITKLELVDADGKPLANQRVILRKGGEGGEEQAVILDEKGMIEIEGDDPFEVLFPELPEAEAS